MLRLIGRQAKVVGPPTPAAGGVSRRPLLRRVAAPTGGWLCATCPRNGGFSHHHRMIPSGLAGAARGARLTRAEVGIGWPRTTTTPCGVAQGQLRASDTLRTKFPIRQIALPCIQATQTIPIHPAARMARRPLFVLCLMAALAIAECVDPEESIDKSEMEHRQRAARAADREDRYREGESSRLLRGASET